MEVMMLLTLFFLINSSICSESGESQNVLSRLSTVEHVLSTLLMEMEELRFDNRKLLMANEELRYNMNITQSHLSFTEEALRHAECDIHNLKKTNSIEGQQTNQVETQHDDQVDELSNLPVNGISDGKLQDGRLIKRDFTTQNPGTSKREFQIALYLNFYRNRVDSRYLDSFISNNRISRSEHLVHVLTWKSNDSNTIL